jgi:predicted GIY-YIG superfamily endonuclease
VTLRAEGTTFRPFVPSEVEGREAGDAVAFWVYILRCSDGRFYTGHTDNLDLRIAQHQHGQGSDFTARRRPVVLVWSDTFGTREEALAAEFQIKPWSRAKKQALIDGDFARLSHFAKPPAERPSTSLGTNGDQNSPFVSSEVETRSREGLS